ncbi:MAG: hypothetical protein HUK15_07065, partial [Bacteroidales bacterium]|nr:hypothetical protein [Bacteroidales bacterium]
MSRVIIFLLLVCFLVASCKNSQQEEKNTEPVKDIVVAEPDTVTATILFVGDFMQHSGQYKAALACGGGERY